MDSRHTAPIMRSITLLILTTSAATVAAAQQQRPRPATASGRGTAEARAVSQRDSLRWSSFEAEIEQVATRLLNTMQAQSQAQQALQALVSGQVDDASRPQAEMAVRRLREQLSQAARESQSLRSRLASLCDRNAKPDGYMGITFSATMQAEAAASGAEVFRFAEYPTVESVDPGSPAERAGVSKGDEIVLIDGQPVVGRDIVFSRLLRPGTRLPLRVRRDGDARDVVLLIKQRPPSLDNGCPYLNTRVMAAFGDPVLVGRLPISGTIVRVAPRPGAPATPQPEAVRPPDAPPTPARTGAVTIVTPTPMPPTVAIPAQAPEAPSQRNVFIISPPTMGPVTIAGATMMRPNSDLRETFGVKSGVLVLDVARGSIAAASGLRGGDVIVSIGRMTVTSPAMIQRAMEAADRELRLTIVRKKRQQTLTLQW